MALPDGFKPHRFTTGVDIDRNATAVACYVGLLKTACPVWTCFPHLNYYHIYGTEPGAVVLLLRYDLMSYYDRQYVRCLPLTALKPHRVANVEIS